jgi:sugar O-acyltransferase (sialic acid O-acetyltransferase NeuD family)
MKKKIIIFGNKDLAQLAKFYLENDKEYKNLYTIVAFTVDKKFLVSETFQELPVVPFDNIEEVYNPEEYLLFAPMTGSKANKVREDVYNRGILKGYKYISYISSKATVLSNNIGDNCFILEDNTIQPFTKIGNNVVMWSGNHIGHHSIIEDNVFFTSHVCLSGNCKVGKNSWFGVNSTIRDNINIADGTLIAMGSSVIKDTLEWGVYMGSPAKQRLDTYSYEVL